MARLKTLTLVIEKGESGYLIGEILELPGCHTQARTKAGLLKRIREAIELYYECESEVSARPIIGIEKISMPKASTF
jgi:predicted RNase H-like HicB family nuclease